MLDDAGRALLGANDRFYLLTRLLGRRDMEHPWIYARCREVEADPDGHLDLWARYHFKSSCITFGGVIQEIVRNPEIKIAIFSVTKPIAQGFLGRIITELENNERLVATYHDVFWTRPRTEAAKWGLARGITVKRAKNPVEATVEAHGLIDGQPTSRHFDLHVYDDIVTQDHLSEDAIRKTTERFELADNLGTHLGVRKQIAGTRYHFADTYATLLERRAFKPRIHPATVDGTPDGAPVLLTVERLREVKNQQRSTFSAQMLLNPIAAHENVFETTWFRSYDVYPGCMNVYIMCDPSKGASHSSDRTAIAVIGIDPGGNKYLLDGYRHRMRLSARYECLKALRAKWMRRRGVQMVRVGYERYGMQADLEVIEDYMRREGEVWEIIELSYPREGEHSKRARIERLEPDLKAGRFYLPAVVYHPDSAPKTGACLWSVWSAEDAAEYEAREKVDAAKARREPTPCPCQVGQIIFRPMRGLTRARRFHEESGQRHRIVTMIRRRDEDGEAYDLTYAMMQELRYFPFGQHDDLIDAASRLYDMDPIRPDIVDVRANEGEPRDDRLDEIVAGDLHDA